MEKYMRLLDEENMDVIVKSCGRKNYEYVFGDNSRWKRTGLIEYYTEGSIKYEKYDEISKEIALEYLFRQNRDLKEIFWYLKEEIVKLSLKETGLLNFMFLNGGFDSLEVDIVSIYFSLGWDFYQQHKDINNKIQRINDSLEILFSCHQNINEEKLIQLRIHRNTGVIAKKIVKYYFNNNIITEEKYQIMSDFFEQKIIKLDEQQKKIIFS